MPNKKLNERGSLMIEMIAVVGLLGSMGTLLYRQMNQRNQELDNINMASEIRTVKEATQAYIQANRPFLEANCVLDNTGYGYMTLDNDEIDYFMPDNWASNRDDDGNSEEDGIVYEFGIYLTCYEIDSDLAPRKALYATIIPEDGVLPENFSLRRASRVANLIGADGGIYTDGTLHGTMGAWEVECPLDSNGGDDVCDGRGDNFFVATTGVDIYIPEVEDAPDNAVVVPDSIAFETLHSTRYFSVGDGSNCVGNMENGKFAHETVDPASGVPTGNDDDIRRVGVGTAPNQCDPLFWVGTTGPAGVDNSERGQVYVKNNLYIGRDNANNRHAVAIETGDTDTNRLISVFSTNGDERLMLDATGKVVGRSNGGRGYRLDAENGEIVLFEERGVGGRTIQVPTMRLKDGVMRTNEVATYIDDNNFPVSDTYKVDPAFTSLMNDIRLTSRGGARLSEILPDYITKQVLSHTFNNNNAWPITKPICPAGYVRAVMVTPVSYSQRVTGASIRFTTPSGGGRVDINDANVSDALNGDSVQLTQHAPVQIAIIDNGAVWNVTATYSGTAATVNDQISTVAQTYCVFDETNFDGNPAVSTAQNGNGVAQEAGTEGQEIGPTERTCADDADCDNTESCQGGVCAPLGACTTHNEEEHLYCIDSRYVYVECTEDSECGTGGTCQYNRCKGGTPTS